MFAFVMAGRRRALRRRPRPRRDQAAVLGPARRRRPLRVGDARLRPRVAAVRRAVPARLRVDARGRAGALRLRRPRGAEARPGDRPPGAADRHARRARARGRAADDGRRPRRRLPLRRPRFLARRRDRGAHRGRATAAACQTFAVGTEDSPDLVAARRVAEHLGTASTASSPTRRPRRSSRCRTSCARSSPSTRASCAPPCPNYMLAREHAPSTSRSCSPARARTSCSRGYAYMARVSDPRGAPHRARAHRRLAAQPQPPALRPRHDGARPRGARALPRPRGDRSGRCASRRTRSHGPSRRRRCCARPSTAGCPTISCGATKAEFGDGSGARDVLSRAVEAAVADAEFAAERDAVEPAAAHPRGARLLPRLARAPRRVSAERTLSRFARA